MEEEGPLADISLAIVGSRDFSDYAHFTACMTQWKSDNPNKRIARVVSGGCRGTDKMAERYADEHGIPKTVHLKYDWKTYRQQAYLMRNTDIVNDCDEVVAFPSDEGSGTQDTMRKAHAKKRKVSVFPLTPAKRASEGTKKAKK